jgi:hypothetical protein
MKIICEKCGKDLIAIPLNYKMAFDKDHDIKIMPCVTCRNEAFSDGMDRVAKQHLELWKDEAADNAHNKRSDND